jgi:hypothetical protein
MEGLPPPRLSVAIYLQHSPKEASQYLSDQYPTSIRDFLKLAAQSDLNLDLSEPSTQNCAVLVLPRTYPFNTPLTVIRHDIETQFPHVPIHPKSRFRQRPPEVWRKQEEFDDGQTVGRVWQTIRAAEERASAQERQWAGMRSRNSGSSSASEDDEGGGVRPEGEKEREKEDDDVVDEHMSGAEPIEGSPEHGSVEEAAGEIHLVVATTAGHLAEIDETLPWDFRLWRRYAVSLNYLVRKKGTNCDDPSEADAELDNEIANLESLEREGGEELRRKLAEWKELVCGVAGADGTEMGSRGEREADIEARMQKWSDTKRESVAAAADSITSPTAEPEGRAIRAFDQDTWEPPDPEEDLLFPAIPPASTARIVAVPLPTDRDAGAEPSRDASFTVRSGAILWGQLHTVFAGSASASFDGKVPPPALSGGTILQHVLNYRAAARNGRWRVRRAYSNTGMQDNYAEPVQHFGYVVHHESIDPMEVLWRCVGKDLAPRQGYVDKACCFSLSLFSVSLFPWVLPFFLYPCSHRLQGHSALTWRPGHLKYWPLRLVVDMRARGSFASPRLRAQSYWSSRGG